jgi:hypothetical protein
MQISAGSSPYAGMELQRLLGLQAASSADDSGQNMPPDDGSAIASDDPPKAHHHHPGGHAFGRFAADTLSSLLGAQESPPGPSDLAAKLIRDTDSNGDGTLSADEISAAMSKGDKASSVSSDDLTAAIAKLDTNGDGQLSADELTSALQAQFVKMAQASGWMAASTSTTTTTA